MAVICKSKVTSTPPPPPRDVYVQDFEKRKYADLDRRPDIRGDPMNPHHNFVGREIKNRQ